MSTSHTCNALRVGNGRALADARVAQRQPFGVAHALGIAAASRSDRSNGILGGHGRRGRDVVAAGWTAQVALRHALELGSAVAGGEASANGQLAVRAEAFQTASLVCRRRRAAQTVVALVAHTTQAVHATAGRDRAVAARLAARWHVTVKRPSIAGSFVVVSWLQATERRRRRAADVRIGIAGVAGLASTVGARASLHRDGAQTRNGLKIHADAVVGAVGVGARWRVDGDVADGTHAGDGGSDLVLRVAVVDHGTALRIGRVVVAGVADTAPGGRARPDAHRRHLADAHKNSCGWTADGSSNNRAGWAEAVHLRSSRATIRTRRRNIAAAETSLQGVSGGAQAVDWWPDRLSSQWTACDRTAYVARSAGVA